VVVLLPIPVLLQIALLLHIGSRGLALLLQFVEGVSANAFNVIVLVVEVCMGSAGSEQQRGKYGGNEFHDFLLWFGHE
jgi:hypothetical protein